MGANKIRAKGTHFLISNNKPIMISRDATTYKTYPVLFRDSMKLAAAMGMSKSGMNGVNLFIPKINKERLNNTRKIVVKVEFIIMV
ncbi:MAG: hypothetical protein ACJAYD_000355 [Patiriisocius sp.]|jgi:hypothetical protein